MKSNELFLRHVLDEIEFLLKETEGVEFDGFIHNELLKRACTRSFEIIGEAIKNLSPEFREKYKTVEWKKFAGLRDKVIHFYFGVNWDIVWDVITKRLPDLKIQIKAILQDQSNT